MRSLLRDVLTHDKDASTFAGPVVGVFMGIVTFGSTPDTRAPQISPAKAQSTSPASSPAAPPVQTVKVGAHVAGAGNQAPGDAVTASPTPRVAIPADSGLAVGQKKHQAK